jgi:hypothetical protein
MVAARLEAEQQAPQPPTEPVKLKSNFPLGTVIAIGILLAIGLAWSLRTPEPKAEPRLVQANRDPAPAPAPSGDKAAAVPPTPPPAPTDEQAPSSPRRLMTILSRPSGANVEIDGSLAGKTPLVLEHAFEPNKTAHVVVIEDGYKRWESDVAADPTGSVNVMAVLEPAPK